MWKPRKPWKSWMLAVAVAGALALWPVVPALPQDAASPARDADAADAPGAPGAPGGPATAGSDGPGGDDWMPPGWRPVPAIAAAAARAHAHDASGGYGADASGADGADAAGVAAWGDPAAGCYLVTIRAAIPRGDPAAFQDAWRARVAAIADVTAWEVAGDVDATDSRLELAHPAARGRARVLARRDPAGAVQVRAGVCFYTPRQPRRSDAHCRALLDRLETP